VAAACGAARRTGLYEGDVSLSRAACSRAVWWDEPGGGWLTGLPQGSGGTSWGWGWWGTWLSPSVNCILGVHSFQGSAHADPATLRVGAARADRSALLHPEPPVQYQQVRHLLVPAAPGALLEVSALLQLRARQAQARQDSRPLLCYQRPRQQCLHPHHHICPPRRQRQLLLLPVTCLQLVLETGNKSFLRFALQP